MSPEDNKTRLEQLRESLANLRRADSQKEDVPKTLSAELENAGLNRPIVFDPALKQYTRAHRAGEPQFQSHEHAELWNWVRSQVMHHVLKSVRDSEDCESFVLRGSILLPTWLGANARKPGDLDWVIVPASLKLNDRQSVKLMDGVVDRLRGSLISESLEIPDRPFASEEIWTYEKAPGMRIIVPWKHSKIGFGGTIQMDFVFGEKLPSPAVENEILIRGQPPVCMLSATAEQSLAWKLLWLTSDMYATGKDLYDSVLLAEFISLDLNLLKRTFDFAAGQEESEFKHFSKKEIGVWHTEWEDFVREYPAISGTADEWKQRLITALEPIWLEMEGG